MNANRLIRGTIVAMVVPSLLLAGIGLFHSLKFQKIQKWEPEDFPNGPSSQLKNPPITPGTGNVNISNLVGQEGEVSISVNPLNPNKQVVCGHAPGAISLSTWYTTDAGAHWTYVPIDSVQDGLVSTKRFDPTVTFGPDGVVYIAYGAHHQVFDVDVYIPYTRIVCGKSTNDGASYSFTTVDEKGQGNLDKFMLGTGRPSATGQYNIYLAYSRRECSGCHFNMYLATSPNGTLSFTPVDIYSGGTVNTFGMPAGGVTGGTNGDVHVVWYDRTQFPIPGEIKFATSSDGGASFDIKALATTSIARMSNFAGYEIPAQIDRTISPAPSIAVDNSPSGSAYRHYGRIYVGYVTTSTPGVYNTDTDIVLQYSDDEGDTWSIPRLVHKSNTHSQFNSWVDVDQTSGAVAVIWYDARNSSTNQKVEVWASVSIDGGETFSEAKLSLGQSDQSSLNNQRWNNSFLEYIGLDAHAGVLYGVWSDNSLDLDDQDYFFGSLSVSSILSVTTRSVPSAYASIQDAIDNANAGDVVEVDAAETTDAPISMASYVQVRPKPGTGRPVLDAQGSSNAVVFPTWSRCSEPALTGFRIIDFSDAGVYCLGTGSVAHVSVEDCIIEGGDRGIDLTSASLTVDTCEVSGQGEYGIHLSDSGAKIGSSITRNMIAGSVGSGSTKGVYVSTGSKSPLIIGNTINGWDVGLELGTVGSTTEIRQNMVTNAYTSGIDGNSQAITLECNNSHTATGSAYLDCGSVPTGNTSLPPLYCNEHEATVAEFTLRIDSPGAPGNSYCGGLIGALPVECAWDSLERNTMVTANTVVKVLEDMYVPAGMTLTLENGVQLLFDAVDESGAGVDNARNEIRIHGTLDVNGTTSSMVEFRSSEPFADPDSWFGLWSGSNGIIDLIGANVQDARYGVYRASGSLADVTVDGCEFSNCETAFIWASLLASGADNELTIKNSTFTLGDIPYGVWLEGLDRVRVEVNTFTGNTGSASAYAIYVNAATSSSAFQALVTGNTITQVAQGSGITIGGQSPAVYGNSIMESKWGMQFLSDSAVVDDNNVEECTTGTYSAGAATPAVTGLTVVNCPTGIYSDGTSKGTYTNVIVSGSATSTGFKAWSKKQGPGDTTPGPIFRHGQIRNFTTNGVLVDSTGFVNLGTGTDSTEAGNNWIESSATSTLKYIQTITPRKAGLADIQAVYNYYGEYPPDSTRFGTNIIYLPALTEAPAKPGMMPLSRGLAPPISNLLLRVSSNPFASGVDFEVSGVPTGDENAIEVIDVSGRRVRRLWGNGSGLVPWDGRDEVGRVVANGLYWARLSYKGKASVLKLVKAW